MTKEKSRRLTFVYLQRRLNLRKMLSNGRIVSTLLKEILEKHCLLLYPRRLTIMCSLQEERISRPFSFFLHFLLRSRYNTLTSHLCRNFRLLDLQRTANETILNSTITVKMVKQVRDEWQERTRIDLKGKMNLSHP